MRSGVKPFFRVRTLDEVRSLAADLRTLEREDVPLVSSLGRTLAADVVAGSDLPGFARATMDGWAVRAEDTFGTAETSPAYLRLCGEVVMGSAPGFMVEAGSCGRIGTGGMLPDGADAVLMVEHSREVGQGTVEVTRPVAPGANVLGRDDDARAGQVVLRAGHRLRPQDVGLLASLGIASPAVVRRPRVGIISTGDEVVPMEVSPAPGQVRDVNTHTLAGQVLDAGGEPVVIGLVPDDEASLRAAVSGAAGSTDLTLLSGGSSMGQRDLTAAIFMSLPGSAMLVHGVSVSPGKPFIWVRAGERNLLGLPGQVASCMIAFHLFVEPMVERLLGREPRSFTRFPHVQARLNANIPAGPGRETYHRVRVHQKGEEWEAEPIFGKSGLLRTLTEGQGLVRVALGSEGIVAGSRVTVMLFP